MDLKDAVGFDRLYESHEKAQQGVTWKDTVARFSLRGAEEVSKLSNQLEVGTYQPRPPVSFTIVKPKKRDILAVSYRDRVYQRSLNDNILYPVMTKSFVKENGACQSGKGTTYCMNLFRSELRRFYINHGLDGYILQIDVRHYYPSMRHDLVKAMFRKKLDDDTYAAVTEILDGQYGGDVGYNPGSQMVQIAGISFLDGVDHFIKEKLRIKDYIRVMDDMVLIHESRDYLEYCLREITWELSELGLEPHEKKTHIVPTSEGIEFLGFKWILTETGKVLLFPKKQAVKNTKQTVRKLIRMHKAGKRTKECVDGSMRPRMAFFALGNTQQLRNSLWRWYHERMDENEKENRFLCTEKPDPTGEGKAGQCGGGGGCRGSGADGRGSGPGGAGGDDCGAG